MLKRLMKQKDVTMAELAETIGYSAAGTSMIVSGKRSCPHHIAKAIAKRLRVKIEDIFDPADSWFKVKSK